MKKISAFCAPKARLAGWKTVAARVDPDVFVCFLNCSQFSRETANSIAVPKVCGTDRERLPHPANRANSSCP
jgi:hypothetical protein